MPASTLNNKALDILNYAKHTWRMSDRIPSVSALSPPADRRQCPATPQRALPSPPQDARCQPAALSSMRNAL